MTDHSDHASSIEQRDTQEEIRFQSRLLAAVGQAVVATDAGGLVIYWNGAAERMFGWPESEALYRPLADVFIPEAEAQVYADLMAQLGRGESWSGDFLVSHRDGTIFPVLTMVTPVFDDSGALVGMIGVSSDIREAKAIEKSLQRSEERLLGVLQASPLAIVELNADAEVLFWNPAAELLYGWTMEESAGQRPRFSRPDHDHEAEFDELCRRALAGEHLHNVEVVRRRKDGARVDVSVSMAPLRDRNGRIVGVTSAGLDITRQRQGEMELRQSQKMDGIGRLAGGIAHDFNNLLTIVLGHADQLLEDLPAEGSATERVQAMQRAARRAADLTDQLLIFSRHQVVCGEPVDLNDVVSSMEPMLTRLVGEHIDLRISLGAGAMVVAPDRLQMQQVVLNLVTNARDAMPHEGVLGITTEVTSALLGPSTALLQVFDTGTGIDERTRANIFEPFFTTKEETKGTGLGLSTVYGVVRQHGGDVDVSSRPGAGSVFTVTLPLWVASDPPPGVSQVQDATVGRAGTVLVVEDEPAVRELVREILLSHGHSVVEAADGDSALAAAATHAGQIDVLVSDVVLPGLSGTELAERLSTTNPGLQVVFMSGYAKHQAGIEGREGRFLAKPFRPSDLAAAVAAALIARPDPARPRRGGTPRRQREAEG